MNPLAVMLAWIGEVVDDWPIWRPFNALINRRTRRGTSR